MKNRFKTIRSLIIAVVCVLLCLVMVFGFAACGEGAVGPAGPAGPQGPQGETGAAGADGLTPYIGENGNWWIGDTDTGVNAGGSSDVPIEVELIAERLVSTKDEVTGPQDAMGKFYSDYDSLEESYKASSKVAEQIGAESFVLLKNADNTLPLKSDEKDITLLGVATSFEQYGGGGSGAGYTDTYGIKRTRLRDGLMNGGFNVNPATDMIYTKHYTSSNLEPGPGALDGTLNGEASIESSFRTYGDAAIVMIKRAGTEGRDVGLSNVEGHSDTTEHYLELDDNEEALVRYAKAHFDKVILFVNSSNTMELGELAAQKTDSNLGVDAIVQVGIPGNNGFARIGDIMNGTLSPSGHTVDTWTYDFTADPTYPNFGNMTQNGDDYDNSVYVGDTAQSSAAWLEYREDIYVGYKYYETMYAEKEAEEEGSGDEWYGDNVLYPFGYGMSYTTFDWELSPAVAETGKIAAANQTVTMQVKVTNTGAVPGKDVVQVYVTPPYEAGGVEKAEVNLMGFAKTRLLQPGESDLVTVEFVAQDAASFDWQALNEEEFQGYVLEAGDYEVSARRNAHDEVLSVTRTVDSIITCETDYTTGREITPVFSQTDGQWAIYNSTYQTLTDNLMTRATGTAGMGVPEAPTKAERTVDQTFIDEVDDFYTQWSYEDGTHNYDYTHVTSVPESWEQYDGEVNWVYEGRPHRGSAYMAERADGSKTELQLSDMAGVNYQDYAIENNEVVVGTDAGSLLWEEFMNQLSWEEMVQIITNADFLRPRVESIGMMEQTDSDGPAQLVVWWGTTFHNNGPGTLWPTAVSIASTWNVELAYEMGRQTGDEALYLQYNGWYGPAMNIHRSPFGGRNFEYYSEDGVLSGKIGAAAVRGAADKGLITYLKHFALNDQETNRSSVYTWATEQAIREIYLKPFELAVKEGGSMGTMAAMNRIGRFSCYLNGALHDGILRGEWGFRGITLTDGWIGQREVNTQLRNGIDLPLGTACFARRGVEAFRWDKDENMVYVRPDNPANANVMIADTTAHTIGENANYQLGDYTMASPTYYFLVRRAALHILWTVVNSSGNFNGWGDRALTYMSTQGTDNHTSICMQPFSEFDIEDVEILNSDLPAGWSFDEELGVLIGTTDAAPGTYSITISCLADGWIGRTARQYYNGTIYEKGARAEATVTITIAQPAATA